jgi:hypothetical protein
MIVSCMPVQQRLCIIGHQPAPAASRVTAALLAVFAITPDPAVGRCAHAFAVRTCLRRRSRGTERRLSRLCWQMLAPPQSLHLLLWRSCQQMLAPP